MAQFQARMSTETGRTVVTLSGECDLAVRDDLVATLRAAVESASVVVVDLAELQFIDSSGIDGLVAGYHAATERGVGLHVVNAGGVVARILDFTGVGELLHPPADDAGASPA